ncbi:MAG: hypothetical protein AABX52_02200 [Nanoarchaeota archaeon]
MKSIPGILYITVGVFVTVVAHYIKHLTFFFWIGILFVSVGIAKVMIKYILQSKPSGEKKLSSPGISFCSQCQIPVYITSHFCHHCGFRLRI